MTIEFYIRTSGQKINNEDGKCERVSKMDIDEVREIKSPTSERDYDSRNIHNI